jgi:hypothetical protein
MHNLVEQLHAYAKGAQTYLRKEGRWALVPQHLLYKAVQRIERLESTVKQLNARLRAVHTGTD